MKAANVETKVREVLTLLLNLNTADAEYILKQSLYNVNNASTLNNIEELELNISGIK